MSYIFGEINMSNFVVINVVPSLFNVVTHYSLVLTFVLQLSNEVAFLLANIRDS